MALGFSAIGRRWSTRRRFSTASRRCWVVDKLFSHVVELPLGFLWLESALESGAGRICVERCWASIGGSLTLKFTPYRENFEEMDPAQSETVIDRSRRRYEWIP